MRRTRRLGVRCRCSLLLNQVGHLALVKSGCDAADFIFDVPLLTVAKCRTVIVKRCPSPF